MNKTIYLREEEAPIWERARELAGDKLSPVIVEALKRFVAEKEAAPKGFERIVVTFNDAEAHFIPKAKAFYGRWIFPPSKRVEASGEDGHKLWKCALAITARGGVVANWIEEEEDGAAEFFRTFPSLEAAAADNDVNWAVRRAIREIGVPVEELDI